MQLPTRSCGDGELNVVGAVYAHGRGEARLEVGLHGMVEGGEISREGEVDSEDGE